MSTLEAKRNKSKARQVEVAQGRRVLRVKLFGIGICILALAAMGFMILPSNKDIAATTVCVSQGDTLWNIASTHSGSMSTQDAVSYIKKANNITDSTIYPGVELTVPAASKKIALN